MSMWDERYGQEEYVYGTEPNDFLREEAGRIPKGRVLCLAEGEGRNAVFLAGLGHEVTAVDLSREGLKKAEKLALSRGVPLKVEQADLADYVPAVGVYTGVVTIFGHLPAPIRKRLYALVAPALVPGGVFILESYRPELVGTPAARDAARFLLLHPPLPWSARPGYGALAGAGVAMLPPWAREHLALPSMPLVERAIALPVGGAATRVIRWALQHPHEPQPV